ncbi:MAG: hydroxyacid dehydrogenase [Oscillospiraceae bacterium]|nr:hydroxyacid dehydrogenase [Oscillospiraceae bacterium]
MKNVLIPEWIGEEGEKMLHGRVNVLRCDGVDELSLCAAVAEADGIVLRSRARITEAVLKSAPRLRVVSRTGVGIDNIDVEACTRHGVMVCYLPGMNAYAVAEHAMALMLALLKCLPAMDRAMRSIRGGGEGTGEGSGSGGGWDIRLKNLPQDTYGKVLGILGLGRIGREVADRARVFGMKTIGYDPYVKQIDGVEWMEPDEVVASADVLTLHLPESEQTRRFMDGGRIARMKPTAYLINTSRGGVVDQAALAQALKEGRIAGAALDVYEDEPPAAGDALLALDNVILTPHVAALTEQCGAAMMREAVWLLLAALDGEAVPPMYIANAAAFT